MQLQSRSGSVSAVFFPLSLALIVSTLSLSPKCKCNKAHCLYFSPAFTNLFLTASGELMAAGWRRRLLQASHGNDGPPCCCPLLQGHPTHWWNIATPPWSCCSHFEMCCHGTRGQITSCLSPVDLSSRARPGPATLAIFSHVLHNAEVDAHLHIFISQPLPGAQ